MFSAYAIQFAGYAMIVVILSAMLGIIGIRYPGIYLFENHFVIEKKCLVDKLGERDLFAYDEIKSVEFVKGSINWLQLILQTLSGKGSFGGFSKPDQMKIKLQDDTVRIFFRIGKRTDFIETIMLMNRKINTASGTRFHKAGRPVATGAK